MIVSRRHRFVFMHNPKVAGSSVRGALEQWRDPDVDLFAVDPDPASPLHRIDRSHIGLAEFEHYYPELWGQVKTLPFFVLYRDSFRRFLSSFNEYCRVYGDTDIRFAATPERRRVFLSLIERLERLGQAEAVMDVLDLTHFRPQWIYIDAPEGAALDLRAFDLSDMAGFTAALSDCIGAPVDFGRENSSEQFDLPGPMRRLLANNAIKKRLRELPGAMWAMGQLRRRSGAAGKGLSVAERYGMSEAEETDLRAFVERFYARDQAVLARLQRRPVASEA